MREVAPGTIIGGTFRVVAPLSEGGMGAVYVAEQVTTGRRRALKVMHRDLLADPKLQERFVQEARIGSRIQSDHVVEVIEAGIDPGTGLPWLAMELLEGRTLADAIRAEGRLAPDRVAEIVKQVCHALAAAHAVGIVHRDLKPENVFLADTKRVGAPLMAKILDFGIAKLLGDAQTKLTGALGTPLYMPPEQMTAGRAITPAADVWALGLMTFTMLTGKSYWLSGNVADSNSMMLLQEVTMQPLVPASQRAIEIGVAGLLPPGFDGFFARTVCREIERRFPTARDVDDAFGALVSAAAAPAAPPPAGMPATIARAPYPPPAQHAPPPTPYVNAVPVATTARSRSPLPIVFAVIGLFVVMGGAAAGFFLWKKRSTKAGAAEIPAGTLIVEIEPARAGLTLAPCGKIRVGGRSEDVSTTERVRFDGLDKGKALKVEVFSRCVLVDPETVTLGEKEGTRVTLRALPLAIPAPPDPSAAAGPPEKVFHVFPRGERAKIEWRAGRPRRYTLVGEVVSEAELSATELASRAKTEWERNGSHKDRDDPALDQAIVHADPDATVAGLLPTIDALLQVERMKGNRRAPAFSVVIGEGVSSAGPSDAAARALDPVARDRRAAVSGKKTSEESLVKALELCGFIRRDRVAKPVVTPDPDAPTAPWGRDTEVTGAPSDLLSALPSREPTYGPNGRLEPARSLGWCAPDLTGELFLHVAEVRSELGDHVAAVRDFRRALAFRPEALIDDAASDAAKADFDAAAAQPQAVVRRGGTSVSGRLKAETIQDVVDRGAGYFRFCMAEAFSTNPLLEGSVTVGFVIEAGGATSSIANAGASLPDSSAVGCVVSMFRRLEFPAPEGGVVRVTVPLRLQPRDGCTPNYKIVGGKRELIEKCKDDKRPSP
ncbi:MAG: protein kinase [Polyangiaceae bacterium]